MNALCWPSAGDHRKEVWAPTHTVSHTHYDNKITKSMKPAEARAPRCLPTLLPHTTRLRWLCSRTKPTFWVVDSGLAYFSEEG